MNNDIYLSTEREYQKLVNFLLSMKSNINKYVNVSNSI